MSPVLSVISIVFISIVIISIVIVSKIYHGKLECFTVRLVLPPWPVLPPIRRVLIHLEHLECSTQSLSPLPIPTKIGLGCNFM